MGRPSNTEERKVQIIHGLMHVMAKHGYDGASVAQIAKAANLTSGLVHYHFKDKLEILIALAEHVARDNRTKLRAYVSKEHSGAPIDAIIEFYLGIGATADPELLSCWIALSGEAIRHKKIRVIFEATLADIKALAEEHIAAGQKQKLLHAGVEADAAAAALVATIQGYFVLAGTARALIPPGSAAATVKAMMTGLLRTQRLQPRSLPKEK